MNGFACRPHLFRRITMNYYYRSHSTTHVSNARNRLRHKKRAKFALCIFILFLLPIAYFIADNNQSDSNRPGGAISDAGRASGEFQGENVVLLPVDVGKETDRAEMTATAAPDPWGVIGAPHVKERKLTVASGQTLIKMLLSAGIDSRAAYGAVNALNDVYDPRRLRPGNELYLLFDVAEGFPEPAFLGFRLKHGVDREAQLITCSHEGFMARAFILDMDSRPVRVSADIDSSLYQAALDSDLPVDVLMQIIRAYSFDVDFQRDIQPGDRIEVLYEEKTDPEGNALKSGDVLYASLYTRGRPMPIYLHETKDGERDYFDADGKSVRKTLMVTPIDGARISSGYGMRRHPIQGYNRMHRGLDFAAPTGTPVMAAGNGIVEYAGRKGSFGHYIRIRHPNAYHTVYAHLSRYASGIRAGVRVQQGQVIGYVGSTGVSTGPHLHYEVHHQGRHVNPATVKTPPGRILEGKEFERFRLTKIALDELYAATEKESRIAAALKNKKEKTDS